MFLNYLRLSLRLLLRNPFFTSINIVGLAIGFASFHTLWEFSTTELKSDQYHTDHERIARIGTYWEWFEESKGTWGHLTFSFSSFFPRVKDEFPEVESFVRIFQQPDFRPTFRKIVNHGSDLVMSVNNMQNQSRVFRVENAVYADSNLFTFFTIPLIHGQPEKVLEDANTVVLSQSTARKYFGEIDPTGKLIRLNDSTTLSVSGVYEDLPHYSHLEFEMVLSNRGLENQWNNFNDRGINSALDNFICYVKLNNPDIKAFEDRINKRAKQYYADTKELSGGIRKLDLFVQPLADIAFSENFVRDYFYPKSKSFLFTLIFIAMSVMMMAWVNYVNLSVTRLAGRFKEIATRKVSGASGWEMAKQFVTEALVINLLAIAVSATVIQFIRTPVEVLFGIQVAEWSTIGWQSMITFFGIVGSGILIAGLYPTFISVAYQPGSLFNMKSLPPRKRFLPSLLTIGQLAAAIIFIMLGFAVTLQLNYILNMDVGINRDQVVVVEAPVIKPHNYSTIIETLKTDLSGLATISSITKSAYPVTRIGGGDFDARRVGSDEQFGMDSNGVDEDFISFYGLSIIAGRGFMKDDRPDALVISRWAATRLGFETPEDAVGANLEVHALDPGLKKAVIIGIIEDFRNTSFLNMNTSSSESNTRGRGIVLMYEKQSFHPVYGIPETFAVRLSSKGVGETIEKIQEAFEDRFPGMLFSWSFLDDKMNEVYAYEKTARNQIGLFSGLAIFIACLGLLGMISNKVVEKTKEIGIRKVLGAQLHQIAQMLLNSTARQLIFATIVSIPVAYYLIGQYLERYSERITLTWWHFVSPVLILVGIMFSTIASVLWKAARNNPVDALKYE